MVVEANSGFSSGEDTNEGLQILAASKGCIGLRKSHVDDVIVDKFQLDTRKEWLNIPKQWIFEDGKVPRSRYNPPASTVGHAGRVILLEKLHKLIPNGNEYIEDLLCHFLSCKSGMGDSVANPDITVQDSCYISDTDGKLTCRYLSRKFIEQYMMKNYSSNNGEKSSSPKKNSSNCNVENGETNEVEKIDGNDGDKSKESEKNC